MRSALSLAVLLSLGLAVFGQHSKPTPSGGKTASRAKTKPKPKAKLKTDPLTEIVNSTPIVLEDERLFDEDDKYITLSGWHLAVRGGKQPDGTETLMYYDPERMGS